MNLMTLLSFSLMSSYCTLVLTNSLLTASARMSLYNSPKVGNWKWRLNCPFCVSFWMSLFLLLLFLPPEQRNNSFTIVHFMAVVGLSNVFSAIIYTAFFKD